MWRRNLTKFLAGVKRLQISKIRHLKTMTAFFARFHKVYEFMFIFMCLNEKLILYLKSS